MTSVASPSLRPAPAWLPTLLAAGLAVILTAVWTVNDWAALRLLRLPDNDDMMRLAEIRDWIGGQSLNDLMQYRLGPPGGAPMHWSRLADAVPAGIVLMLTPRLGTHAAELAAVVASPALLFFLYLLLAGRIADIVGGGRVTPVAIILAALAFPTISLFIPGRIDHHALQIVLLFALVAGLVRAPSGAVGAAMGVLAALSLAIGLEAAPELIAVMVALGWCWMGGERRENARAAGFGVGLLATTGFMLSFLHPDAWPRAWCDGFTAASTSATLALGAGWVALGVMGARLQSYRSRLIAAAAVGGAIALSASQTSLVCIAGPYDALHPFLKQAWMANVAEARGLFFDQNSPGIVVAFGMLSAIGTVVAAIDAVRTRDRSRIALAMVLGISLVAAVAQVRVTYILAGMATVPIALRIAALDPATQALRRLRWWALGAGMVWYLVGSVIDTGLGQSEKAARRVYADCIRAKPFIAVGRQPTGTLMAPINDGAYFIGLTSHHVVAAPYHRNNAGNLASYRFFLATPERAETIARQWAVDYVAVCPGDLRERNIERLRNGSLIDILQRGGTPDWLVPIATGGSLRAFRVRQPQRLSKGAGHA